MLKDRLDNYKNFAAIVQAWATVIAIVVGGGWTYLHFKNQRIEEPRLRLEAAVEALPFAEGKQLVNVVEDVRNSGNTQILLRSGTIILRRILPLPPKAEFLGESSSAVIRPEEDVDVWSSEIKEQYSWKEGEFPMEPGESERVIAKFVIPCSIQVVEVIGFFSDKPFDPNGIGWRSFSVVDLSKGTSPPSCKKQKS